MATITGQNFGASKPQKNSSGNSRGQNVSFLDSEDCIWHENPREEVITFGGNGRFYAVLEYNR
jgi:hypothetical protein